MTRRTLVILSVGLLVPAVAFLAVTMRRSEAPSESSSAAVKPTAPAAVKAPPRVEVPAPGPRRTAPRDPAPRLEPPPAAVPAAVAAPPTVGVLRIDSDVAGAQVFIDRAFVGATPVTVPDVKPGAHTLNVSAPGYDGVAEAIDVSPGPREILIKFKVVRLDVKMDVVHKHRMGSCAGRLVATPEGLRYETSNTRDGFSAALLDLETFQVDYLKKNLRVKPRSGRRYDFTDTEGSADALFVFHRDVEKARERLLNGDPPAQP